MICMQRTFGHPVIVPPGNNARSASTGDAVGAQAAAHVGDDVMHVRIRLGDHVLVHRHAAGFAHAPEIVALEVDQHDVLGAFLGMRDRARRCRADPARRSLARARAGDGPRRDLAALMRSSRSGDDEKSHAVQLHAGGERRRIRAAQRGVHLRRRSARRAARAASAATGSPGRCRRRRCVPARARTRARNSSAGSSSSASSTGGSARRCERLSVGLLQVAR